MKHTYLKGDNDMKLTSNLTKMMHVQYPIIQAGMAGSTTPELVAAVSNAGGLGSIGAGYFSADKLKQEIEAVEALTDLPYVVNLFVPSEKTYIPEKVEHMNAWLKPYRRAFHLEEPVVNLSEQQQFDEAIRIIIDQEVPIASFTFGIPDAATIEKLKAHQIKLIGTATSVEEAIANEQAGMDVVIAQGSEAGGHRGAFIETSQSYTPLIGTMSLVPQIVDAVNIPVVAAGGIMDSRGLVASIALGAEGIQMGTAFLTTEESGASQLYKDAISQSKETDSLVTHVFTGKPARGINNDFIRKMNEFDGDIPDYPIQNQLTTTLRKASAQAGDPQWTHLWSGQSPRLAQHVTAQKLMEDIIQEAQTLIQT